jgi:hypothetical protein
MNHGRDDDEKFEPGVVIGARTNARVRRER